MSERIPRYIYLQWYGLNEYEMQYEGRCEDDVYDEDQRTWCQEKQYDTDVPYVRLDRHKRMVAELLAENKDLEDALYKMHQTEERLRAELDNYRNGYEGSCMACEPVARQNDQLRAEIAQYQWLLQQAIDTKQEDTE